jgi:hypothetical protein
VEVAASGVMVVDAYSTYGFQSVHLWARLAPRPFLPSKAGESFLDNKHNVMICDNDLEYEW